ncbi:MAG: tetratricopeptide repeat protein [Planctomycetes bacterium]|nr:tetratricopeptide repeat protein [Planctomycetota bacterium]
MAKRRRKKLNRKALIALGVVGVLVVGAGVAALIRFLPKDPAKYFADAKAKVASSEYNNAAGLYVRAVNAASKRDLEQAVEYRLAFADFLDKWPRLDQTLNQEKVRAIVNTRLSELQAVMRDDPRNKQAQDQLTDFFWTQAIVFKHWEKFLEEAEKQLRITPDDAQTYHRIAIAHTNLAGQDNSPEQLTFAKDAYAKAAELDPTNVQVYLDWSVLCSRQEDANAAREVLSKALIANPDAVLLRIAYAQYLLFTGDVDVAEAQFAQALSAPNKSALDYEAIGRYHLISLKDKKEPDIDKAMSAFTEALQVDPKVMAPYLSISRIHAYRQQTDQAVAVLRDAMVKTEASRWEELTREMKPNERMQYLNSLLAAHESLASLLLWQLRQQKDRDAPAVAEKLAEAKTSVDFFAKYHSESVNAAKLQGTLALVEGNTPDAEKFFRKAYEGSVRQLDREATLLLVQLYLSPDRAQYGEAERILNRLSRAYPNDVPILMQMAQLQLAFRWQDKADQTLKLARQLSPTDEQLSAIDKMELALSQMIEQASQTTTQQMQVEIPEQITEPLIQPLLQKAVRLELIGNLSEAAELYMAIYRQHPSAGNVLSRVVRMYQEADQAEKAKQYLAEGLKSSPDSEEFKFLEKLLGAETQAQRLQVETEYIEAHEQGVRKELLLARLAQKHSDQQSYREHLLRAIEIDPLAGNALGALFLDYLLAKEYDRAAELATKAEQLNIDDAGGKLFRARLLMAQSDWDGVISVLKELLKEQPQHSEGHALMGAAYLSKGDLLLASDSFNLSYQQNPANPAALIGLARLAEQKGQTADHELWINRAYTYAPKEPYVRAHWLRYQELRSDPAGLIKIGEQRRSNNPDDGQNLLMLARAYTRVDPPRSADAEAIYRKLYADRQGKAGSLAYLQLLVSFLRDTDRGKEVPALLDESAKIEPDKVGLFVLYGQHLAIVGQDAQALEALRAAIAADSNDPRAHEAMMKFASDTGNWDTAISEMEKVVQLLPGQPSLRLTLIQVQLNGGRYEQAKELADTILSENSDDFRALALKARAIQMLGQLDQAIDLYGRILDAQPTMVAVRLWRAGALIGKGRLDEAVRDLQEALLVTNAPEIAIRLANIYITKKDPASAKTVLVESLAANEGSTKLMFQLASLYLSLDDWAPLEQTLEAGKKLMPTSGVWHVLESEMWGRRKDQVRQVAAAEKAWHLEQSNVQLLMNYLSLLLDIGRNDEVIAIADKIKESSRDVATMMLASVGRARLAKGNENGGLANIQQALKLCQGSEAVFVGRQLARAGGGAVRYLDLLNRLVAAEDTWAGRMLLGTALSENGESAEAIAALKKIDTSKIDDRSAFLVYRVLAEICQRTGQYEASREAYLQAMKKNPNDLNLLNNFACLLTDNLNKPGEAVKYASMACSLAPNNANVADTLGWAYFAAGDLSQAERELYRSIDLGAASANRYHLGRVLERLDRTDEARQQYQMGFELVRDNEQDDFYQKLKDKASLKRDTP